MRQHNWGIRLIIAYGYAQWRWLKLPSMPSYERKLYHPDDSDQNQAMIWTTSAVLDGTLDAGWVWEWRNGGLEVRDSGAEEIGQFCFRTRDRRKSNQLSVPFFCFFSSLLFFILHYFIASRPGTKGVGTGFYHLRMAAKWGCSFHVRWIHRTVTLSRTDRSRDLWDHTMSCAAWLFNSVFPFPFSCTVYAARGVCSWTGG